MEIKRNIFESSARMPAAYNSFTAPMTPTDLNSSNHSTYEPTTPPVHHAPIPRIGEQK
jgi:hypothetical protein